MNMESKAFQKVADFLLYAGATTILVWAVLKAIHVIQSPVWVEMIPYMGGAISILALAYKAGNIVNKIDGLDNDIHELRGIKKDIMEIRENLAYLSGAILGKKHADKNGKKIT